MEDTGHRADLALYPGAMHDKERLNQVGRGELVLPHELPDRSRPTPPPWSVEEGEGHEGKTRERQACPQRQTGVAPPSGTCFAFFCTRTHFPGFTFKSRRA